MALPEFVEDDGDLPDVLNTAAKQQKRAKALAAAHLGKKAHRALPPEVQGFLSRTQIIQMVGGDRIVIQFRIKPLETEYFAKARRLLGDVVPEIEQLEDEEVQAVGMTVYAMTYMPGRVWFNVPSSPETRRINIAASLGTILGRGFVANDSTHVVESYVVPCLKRFRDSIRKETKVLQPHVERLIAAAPQLAKLPLYVSHLDLNEMNVLVGKDDTVSGIVDWEGSSDLPFGMGLHRVTDTIVAENSLGTIHIPTCSEEAEKAFWSAVLSNAPPVVLNNLDIVQTALHIGSLLFAFNEKHLEGPEPKVDFLAGILTYRLPQLRGDAGPFAPECLST